MKNNHVKGLTDALLFLAKRHKNLVILSADFGGRLGLKNLSEKYSEQYFNMGLAESNLAGVAAGFVLRGKIPVIIGFSNFILGKAWEQIRDLICYPNLNVKIVGLGAGFSAASGGVGFQAFEDIALARVLPNMQVVYPADYYETLSATKAMLDTYGPVYMRLSRSDMPDLYDQCKFEFGKSDLMIKGDDIVIFSNGTMLAGAMQVAKDLKKNKVEAAVMNVSSLKPLDEKNILKIVQNKKAVFALEDHSVIGGLGSALAELLSEQGNVKLFRIGMDDRFGESGKESDLIKKYGFDPAQISEKILNLL